jgi:putative nucleotidyltransferase with HDIG domain
VDPEALIREWVEIPTLPEVVVRINRLIEDPHSGLREIGALISEDPPLSSQVLRSANSAYYGFAQRVVSLEHAATLLGSRSLRNLVLQASVMKTFSHLDDHPAFDARDLWNHSILTGQLSWTVAFRSKVDLQLAPEEFYVIGLLHDIGKFVMLDALGEQYVEILERAQRKGKPLFQLERQALSFHHGDVGALVASRWKLPLLVGKTIRNHHGPIEAVLADPRVAIVATVNALIHHVAAGDMAAAALAIDDPVRRSLGLSNEDIADIILYAAEVKDHLGVEVE